MLLTWATCKRQIIETSKHRPALTGPGPVGLRKEHWITRMQNPEYVSTLVPLIAELAVEDLHKQARVLLKRGIVSPLPKPQSG